MTEEKKIPSSYVVPQLHFMRGMSGCGKTTKAEEIMKDLPENVSCMILSTDDYFVLVEDEFDVGKLGTAHCWNFSRFIDAIEHGVRVIIIDNTNTRLHEFQDYWTVGERSGYDVYLWNMNPETPEKALEAALRNKHRTPLWKCFQQWERFEKHERDL